MPSDESSIPCTTAPLPEVDADLLVFPFLEDDPLADVDLDSPTNGDVSRARERRECSSKPYELYITQVTDSRWKAQRVALIGVGPRDRYTSDRLRKAATAASLAARQRRIGRIAFVLRDSLDPDMAVSVQAIAEGLTLAELGGNNYKTTDEGLTAPSATIAVREAPAHVVAAANQGRILGECSNEARTLTNEPGNKLTPRILADRASALVRGTGVEVDVLDEQAIAGQGMGLLLGVARGSVEPPRLIVLRYTPRDAAGGPVLGLVGKGVTFDTGGISIKDADGMERMKDDMAGGAAVICAMRAIGLLKPPIPVVGVVPATENMPGGRAVKPGDVLHSASGKSVEVVNTDAEGRLVLGDALWFARHAGATHLVDIATLTGACIVALGKLTTGLFGRPDSWVDVVRRVAEREGDRAWPLPLIEEYAEQLKSDVADLVNSGGRPAGAITAALFLREFIGDLPWAHLDIAGTAWTDEAKPYLPKGASGVGVRTLAELPFTSAMW